MGLILIGVGAAIGLAVGAWILAALADGSTGLSGAILGFVLLLIFLVAPLIGGGIYILTKGRAEERELAHVRSQRALIDIVKTRGQVQISDLVLELKSTRDQVQQNLYDLVGRGLFPGTSIGTRACSTPSKPRSSTAARPARIAAVRSSWPARGSSSVPTAAPKSSSRAGGRYAPGKDDLVGNEAERMAQQGAGLRRLPLEGEPAGR